MTSTAPSDDDDPLRSLWIKYREWIINVLVTLALLIGYYFGIYRPVFAPPTDPPRLAKLAPEPPEPLALFVAIDRSTSVDRRSYPSIVSDVKALVDANGFKDRSSTFWFASDTFPHDIPAPSATDPAMPARLPAHDLGSVRRKNKDFAKLFAKLGRALRDEANPYRAVVIISDGKPHTSAHSGPCPKEADDRSRGFIDETTVKSFQTLAAYNDKAHPLKLVMILAGERGTNCEESIAKKWRMGSAQKLSIIRYSSLSDAGRRSEIAESLGRPSVLHAQPRLTRALDQQREALEREHCFTADYATWASSFEVNATLEGSARLFPIKGESKGEPEGEPLPLRVGASCLEDTEAPRLSFPRVSRDRALPDRHSLAFSLDRQYGQVLEESATYVVRLEDPRVEGGELLLQPTQKAIKRALLGRRCRLILGAAVALAAGAIVLWFSFFKFGKPRWTKKLAAAISHKSGLPAMKVLGWAVVFNIINVILASLALAHPWSTFLSPALLGCGVTWLHTRLHAFEWGGRILAIIELVVVPGIECVVALTGIRIET